jgi:hypothetical protein
MTMISRLTISAFAAFALVACGTDTGGGGTDAPAIDPNILPNLHVPPPPANGIQVITPIVRGIAPGTDLEMCTWTDKVLEHQTDVRKTASVQTEPGHHVVVYYTTQKQPAGTSRPCTDTDMTTFRFLSGTGGDGISSEAPGDLVFRIPAGAQVVINHHYLNATDETLDAQSAINIDFADPGGTYRPSGSMAYIDTAMMIPTGQSAVEFTCTLTKAFKTWLLIPHMHQWGKHINVDITQSGATSRAFDTDWNPSFAFHPPQMQLPLEAPLSLAAGDQVKVHCDYDNDTGNPIYFGLEMCITFGQFIDDQGIGGFECDNGHWGPF